MIRPEFKQPKNAAGIVLVFIAAVCWLAPLIYIELPEALFYIGIGLYVTGMILLVIPGKQQHNQGRAAADPDHDHTEKKE